MVYSMANKVVWFINQYASTPEVSLGGRHYYLAKNMVRQGVKVYVIAASNTHLHRNSPKVDEEFKLEEVDGINYVWIKVPSYQHAHSKKRILNWFLFSWKIRKLPKVLPERPDSILYSSPALVGFLGAEKLAKKLNSKLVFEVRDIWPLTFVKVGGYSPSHPFIRLMHWIEKRAYQNSDVLISNLKYAYKHIQKFTNIDSRFHWIPNGIPLDDVKLSESPEPAVLDAIPLDKFVVGYTGTIGMANALEHLIDAAELLRSKPEFFFVLVGNGRDKQQLENVIRAKQLTNILILPSIKKTQIQPLLEKFDACFIGWKNEELYQFGIAPNKLPEYLYSQRPVIHAFSGQGDYVVEANAGVSVSAESPVEIANAVETLYQLPVTDRQQLGKNGRSYVLKHLDYEQLAEKLNEIL